MNGKGMSHNLFKGKNFCYPFAVFTTLLILINYQNCSLSNSFQASSQSAVPNSENSGSTPTPNSQNQGKIPVIVAQGFLGRTVMSCDDGKTWINNRSWMSDGDSLVCGMKQTVRCGQSACYTLDRNGSCVQEQPCSCSHSTGDPRGVVFGKDSFVATFGWGAPGKVIRSTNGKNWEKVLDLPLSDTGGIAFGDGKFILASREPVASPDGANWEKAAAADFRAPDGTAMWSVRHFIFFPYLNGRFIATADLDILLSANAGGGWFRPDNLSSECGNFQNVVGGGPVYGNGILLTVGPPGFVCRSTDGGLSWTKGIIGAPYIYSGVVFHKGQFLAWSSWDDTDGGYFRYSSVDGLQWTRTKMATETGIGKVVETAGGSLVATNGFWNQYEGQNFIRSTDGGITWSQGTQSSAMDDRHSIIHMSVGYVSSCE